MTETSKAELSTEDNGHVILSSSKSTIQRETKYKIALINEITHNIEDYKKLLNILDKAEEADTIELNINSGGGSCRTGYHIALAMKKCKAEINVVVSYNCSSMAAVLSLCGTSLLMNPGSTLMFHNYSAGNLGKGAELVQSIQQQALQMSKLMEHYCSPFLTPAELEKINNDKDVYVHAWDKNLKARTKRHFK